MTFQRPNIEKMHGYTPGEQLPDSDVIKLNTNENPYPPSPAVDAALRAVAVSDLRRYPPPLANAFCQQAANLHGLAADNIIPTNGGDEFLRLVLTTFVAPDETVVVMRPSYSLYPVLTAIHNCRLQEIDLNSDWSMPADFSQQLNRTGAKLCILVNPQAPSGGLLSTAYLAELAENFPGLLLVDEAYVDFVDPELAYDSAPLVSRHSNLLLLRTLSKGYSLAGLRFGYGLGASELISPMLYKTRDSYNTDLVAQQLATAALADQDYARANWEKVRQSRQQLMRGLQQLGIKPLPSQTNFLLCELANSPAAKSLHETLRQHKILVRYFEQDRLRDKLRISVGSDQENAALLQAISEILQA